MASIQQYFGRNCNMKYFTNFHTIFVLWWYKAKSYQDQVLKNILWTYQDILHILFVILGRLPQQNHFSLVKLMLALLSKLSCLHHGNNQWQQLKIILLYVRGRP